MSNLPIEILKLVVEALHRPIPAAGEAVNWNDDLHQGDLLAMQRVNKVNSLVFRHQRSNALTIQAMYGLVAPILYAEPIVQDLGLFLRGIEGPPPDSPASRDESIEPRPPFHKRQLLKRVSKLHIVTASRRDYVRPYLRLPNNPHEPSHSTSLDIDVLGRADLDGMQEANRMLGLSETGHGKSHRIFPNLHTVSLGSWDDGRWAAYLPTVPTPFRQPGSFDLKNRDLWSVVDETIKPLSIFQGVDLCVVLRQGMLSVFPPICRTEMTPQSRIRIIHNGPFDDLRHIFTYPGPARIYVSTDSLARYRDNLTLPSDTVEPFRSYGWAIYISAPQKSWSQERMSAFKLSTVELCIVPGGVGDLDDQEALAREVKEALELYHEEACKTKADARLWRDRTKILVGREVIACPCCGSKTR